MAEVNLQGEIGRMLRNADRKSALANYDKLQALELENTRLRQALRLVLRFHSSTEQP